MAGRMVSLGAVPGKASDAGLFEAGFTGLADGLAASFVFVVGRDVADALVEPDGVVVSPDDGQFGS